MSRSSLAEAIRQFVRGALLCEPALVPMKQRAEMERIFFLTVFGDRLGIPVMRPYYSLRLLPHVVPRIRPWMRSLLRERDLTDMRFD